MNRIIKRIFLISLFIAQPFIWLTLHRLLELTWIYMNGSKSKEMIEGCNTFGVIGFITSIIVLTIICINYQVEGEL